MKNWINFGGGYLTIGPPHLRLQGVVRVITKGGGSYAQMKMILTFILIIIPVSLLVHILLIMVLTLTLTPIPFPIMIIITRLFLYILALYLHSLYRLFQVKFSPIISTVYITCEIFCTSCAKKCLIISTIYRRLAQVCARFFTTRKLRNCLKCF